MTYEEAVKAWAVRRLNAQINSFTKEPYPPVTEADIESVKIEGNGGWGGTDVTAGDPGEFAVTAVFTNGSQRDIIDFTENADGSYGMYAGQSWDFATLLHEILDAGGEG